MSKLCEECEGTGEYYAPSDVEYEHPMRCPFCNGSGVMIPICKICKKQIDNVWEAYEKKSYISIGGEVTMYVCFDCQLRLTEE